MCFDTFFRLKDLGTFYEIKMNILERHVSRLVGRISQFRLVDEQFNRILLLSLYTVQRDTFLFLFFLRWLLTHSNTLSSTQSLCLVLRPWSLSSTSLGQISSYLTLCLLSSLLLQILTLTFSFLHYSFYNSAPTPPFLCSPCLSATLLCRSHNLVYSPFVLLSAFLIVSVGCVSDVGPFGHKERQSSVVGRQSSSPVVLRCLSFSTVPRSYSSLLHSFFISLFLFPILWKENWNSNLPSLSAR